MIRSLRRAHLRRSLAMAILLPLGLGAALLARQEMPRDLRSTPSETLDASAPDALLPERSLGTFEWRADREVDDSIRVEAFLLGQGEPLLIELRTLGVLNEPDLLLYAAAPEAQPAGDAALPPDSILLGSFRGTGTQRVRLPQSAQPGRLLLYSLAHGELLGELITHPENR